jgi:hypothetical protein
MSFDRNEGKNSMGFKLGNASPSSPSYLAIGSINACNLR